MPTLSHADLPAVVTKLQQAVKAEFGREGKYDSERCVTRCIPRANGERVTVCCAPSPGVLITGTA